MTRSLRFLMFILYAPFGVLAAVSTTLADADALYKQKKWIPAAKAYEAFASGRSGVLCIGTLGDDAQGRQFFRFIEDTWPNDPIAEQALLYRLMLAIWTKQWEEAGKLRADFMRLHPASTKLKMVEGECGQLIARRVTVLEENIIR